MKGQINVSSVGMELSGIDSISSTSLCINKLHKASKSHLLESESINKATNKSSKPSALGVEIKGRKGEGSHGFDHTQMEVPSPTLHLIPSFSTSLPTKILLHA